MTTKDILAKCDHTLLAQTATWEEIRQICDDGIRYGTASVCIPPAYVKQAKAYVGCRLPICTVIGFPNGYNTTAVKCFETADAVENGADEIDMVVNLGWVRDGKFDAVLDEIKAVKAACGGRLIRNFPSRAVLSPRASSFPAASVRAAETHTPSAASPNRRISFPRHRTAPSVNSADGFSFFSIWLAYPLFFRYSRFFRISSARCRTQSGLRSGSSGVLNT